jgi:hypothetical protein
MSDEQPRPAQAALDAVIDASIRLMRAKLRLQANPEDVRAEVRLRSSERVLSRAFPSAGNEDLHRIAFVVVELASAQLKRLLKMPLPTAIEQALPKPKPGLFGLRNEQGEQVDIRKAVAPLLVERQLTTREIVTSLEAKGLFWQAPKLKDPTGSFRVHLRKAGFKRRRYRKGRTYVVRWSV